MERTFMNEVGNNITVKTNAICPSGGQKQYWEVEIQILGPTSNSTWTITLQEAREIYRQLKHTIGSPPGRCRSLLKLRVNGARARGMPSKKQRKRMAHRRVPLTPAPAATEADAILVPDAEEEPEGYVWVQAP